MLKKFLKLFLIALIICGCNKEISYYYDKVYINGTEYIYDQTENARYIYNCKAKNGKVEIKFYPGVPGDGWIIEENSNIELLHQFNEVIDLLRDKTTTGANSLSVYTFKINKVPTAIKMKKVNWQEYEKNNSYSEKEAITEFVINITE